MVEVIIMSPLTLLVVLPYTANRFRGCSVSAMSTTGYAYTFFQTTITVKICEKLSNHFLWKLPCLPSRRIPKRYMTRITCNG